MMDKALCFPAASAYDRIIAKAKIFQQAGASRAVKALFQQQLERIRCCYEITEQSTNLKASQAVPKLLIIELQLTQTPLDKKVLHIIDKAFSVPLIFELCFASRLCYTACYRRRNVADQSKWVLSGYFQSDWISKQTPKEPVPVALDLESLYEQLIQYLVPLSIRANETMEAFITRAETIRGFQEQARALLKKTENKKLQYNRRVEYHAEQRALERQIRALTFEG